MAITLNLIALLDPLQDEYTKNMTLSIFGNIIQILIALMYIHLQRISFSNQSYEILTFKNFDGPSQVIFINHLVRNGKLNSRVRLT